MSKYKKCGYYSDGECNICGMGMSGEDTFCRLCKDNPSCYYKQLDKLKTKKDKYYQQTLDDEIQINELHQTLQEIKEFCKKEIEYFDNNDNYGQQADWIALLQKITKAEEE